MVIKQVYYNSERECSGGGDNEDIYHCQCQKEYDLQQKVQQEGQQQEVEKKEKEGKIQRARTTITTTIITTTIAITITIKTTITITTKLRRDSWRTQKGIMGKPLPHS